MAHGQTKGITLNAGDLKLCMARWCGVLTVKAGDVARWCGVLIFKARNVAQMVWEWKGWECGTVVWVV